MNYKAINLEQGSPQWLEFRKDKITASIVADCIGISGAFNSPKERAMIMRGLKTPNFSEKQKAKMQMGIEKEVEIMCALNDKGFDFLPSITAQSTINPLFVASLDLRDFKTKAIAELKYSNIEFEYLKKHRKPSDKYYAQVQFQLMVIDDAPYAIFAVMNESGELDFVKIEREESYIKAMLKKIDIFIEKYLLNELSDLELSDDESLALSVELIKLSERTKDDLKRIDELKKLLCEKGKELGEKCSCNGVLIYPSTRKSVDYKGFLESKKLVVDEAFIKENTSWCVKI